MKDSLRTLLEGTLDYAGLFPPASLAMRESAENFERYRASEHAWLLGRFVVPAKRMEELGERHWPLAVLVNIGGTGVETSLDATGANVCTTMEIPIDDTSAIGHLARAGLRVKIRTGGVTEDAVPSTGQLAAFLIACHAARAPFKATAGLHHPLRSAAMHGFLNLFVAAAFVRNGLPEDELPTLLEERSADAFRFDDAGAAWRGRRLTTAQLAESRARFATAFGSCSFDEPVAELTDMGLL